MRTIILALFLFSFSSVFSQWTTLGIPEDARFEDLFFLNDTLGWTVNASGTIYKTVNGGNSWDTIFQTVDYLRSIEFLTEDIGFAGSLDSTFFKTIDGGQTWTEISDQISPDMPGICGLSSPTSNSIYGVGLWAAPAYMIKSIDSGNTWDFIDMSSLASALVDVNFINQDTGFVSGLANPATDGGVILYTTDGGNSWTTKYKSMNSFDFVWKMQSPDGKHYFGSIESLPANGDIRIARSKDGGMTWSTDTVSEDYEYMQTVGFMDSLNGWTGGRGGLYETTDGGETWYNITLGSNHNRFQRINDTLAYMTGQKIYKFTRESTTNIDESVLIEEYHELTVSPNPTSDILNIEMLINRRTNCKLELYSADGKLVKSIIHKPMNQGTSQYSISLNQFPPQTLYLILKTNEGLMYRKVIKL